MKLGSSIRLAAIITTALMAATATPIVASAENLFNPNSFSSLIGDRHAQAVGDSLSVVIREMATTSNTTKSSATKAGGLGGQFQIAGHNAQGVQLGINNSFDGMGLTSHSEKVLAQISVVVYDVLPNGDLRVMGDQTLNINGEHTRIKLKGRVRVADISNSNSVLSSNLADAVIDYDGKGFVAASAKPGLVSRIFGWLGLL